MYVILAHTFISERKHNYCVTAGKLSLSQWYCITDQPAVNHTSVTKKNSSCGTQGACSRTNIMCVLSHRS